ncbi:LacI family DNA-binding transcriptional regulator [Bacillus vallismortis]|uniref:LacI family DNA-binding transcriptional regulator n=1 Tax=Bacillus vallismortis TaxID=72361 RepID=A0AAP3FS59_BACVA|nr:LacI family DNA-binding transcriptional regulator [Bacillus vallismortis]MBG9770000.1 LacI family transcriptional regulator [Bacillus vallismortis]MCY8316206.1 LacI family DNA-binding transcriptional regulator [Bacillus vallismortis]MEC1269443.1 LacI family DNA-binding transcriptional regulator [Bacillus vallismortis]MEC1652433.1 LacI family DNA-binding transcriptional regulator [Bacillus vallismortis]QAV09102.1 LacI family DNA-binding transcriptional regulator [Bacillus vallismortis]
MANIKDIAEKAGVSITTVSRVINNHPYVSEDKRNRVFEAMEALAYTRNIHAVHLSKGYSNMIGVVLPTINLPYFAELIGGIADAAEGSGIHLSLFQTNYDIQKEIFALTQLKERQVDGLIFCSKALADERLMDWKGPILLCQNSDIGRFSTISIPHEQAFRYGLDYLMAKGHKKIAICLARKKGMNSHFRIKAYREALEEIGEAFHEDWVIEKAISINDGKALFHKWKNWKEKPTAIFVANDQVSAGLLLEAKARRVLVPDELAILSVDNHEISQSLGITTIDIQTKEMGKQAFAMLEKRIQGQPIEKKVLDYRLIERSTV